MEPNDTQIKTESASDGTDKKKKSNNTLKIIISLIIVAVIAVSVILYINLYKKPHDEAIANYNAAVTDNNTAREQYNVAAAELEERNRELDDCISSLTQVINTDNIPIDELLLAEPNSILQDAREIPKDSAPALSDMPVTEKAIEQESTENIESVTTEIIEGTSKIAEMVTEVQAMGDYSDTIELLTSTESEYQKMIDDFAECEADLLWFSVDEDACVLRFLVQLSNPNAYTLRGVTTEWIAYDKNDAIVGSIESVQPDIPANGQTYYVGGAGSAHLSGIPARVEVRIKSSGLLTNRELPQITVSDVQLESDGLGWYYTVSAYCVPDADIQTADLDGQFIVKDADGQVIGADFWSADNLPDSIDANGKFSISDAFFDLPVAPATAEVYVYYVY